MKEVKYQVGVGCDAQPIYETHYVDDDSCEKPEGINDSDAEDEEGDK